MKKIQIDSDKILTSIVVILGVVIIFLGIVLFLMFSGKLNVQKEPEEYSRDKYYQMVTELTEDNIKFYVHDSQIYLDDTFSEPVGTIYKREDESMYILYNEKEYDLTESDLEIREVKIKGD